MDRALVAAALIAVVGLAAIWLRRRSPAHAARVEPGDVGLGSRSGVGVVGFSSPYCLPCQAWEAALVDAGIPFVKVDVGERPDLARRYGVRSTPLVLAVGLPGGEVLASFDDAPSDGEVERLTALARGR
jgi:hypothetical protein